MLSRIALSIIVGIAVSLLCVFVGGLLITVEIALVAATGAFLNTFAGLLGLLAALWYFFSGYAYWPRRP